LKEVHYVRPVLLLRALNLFRLRLANSNFTQSRQGKVKKAVKTALFTGKANQPLGNSPMFADLGFTSIPLLLRFYSVAAISTTFPGKDALNW
jgi:hypothetical protein